MATLDVQHDKWQLEAKLLPVRFQEFLLLKCVPHNEVRPEKD